MISEQTKDTVRLWITAIIAAPLLGGVVLYVLDIDGIRSEVTDSVTGVFVNCDDLEEDVTVDLMCLNNPSCTMTREELSDSNGRSDRFKKFCDSEAD